MIVGVVVQQPNEILDWDIKYDDWLGIDSIDPDPSKLIINIIPNTGTLSVTPVITTDTNPGPDMVKLWIQGGEDGDQYTVEVTAVSAAGRTKQDEVIVHIKDYV